MKKANHSKGFTLIELMIVVAIIGILAAIAIPNYLGIQKKAKIRNIMEASSSAEGELVNFLQAWSLQEDGIADIDNDGDTDSNDTAPATITAAVIQWLALQTGSMSPFNPTTSLFTTAAASSGTGRIHVTVSGPNQVTIRAMDDDSTQGTPVYTKIIKVE